jgi:rhodanese-related sulfurtransferase
VSRLVESNSTFFRESFFFKHRSPSIEGQMPTISVEKLHPLLTESTVRVLDVRSPAEFAIDHIPASVNIPMEQIEVRMADVPDGQLVLICEGGKRAQIVGEWLRDRRQVAVLEGGIRSWRRAGLPTLACAPCRWSLERQVRLLAGIMVLAGALLAVFVGPSWVFLPMFVGAGLSFAGLTNICGMGVLLGKMPWNSQSRPSAEWRHAGGADHCT